MDKDINLNTPGMLPDGTAASQSGGFGAKAGDFKRGFMAVEQHRPESWTEDTNAPEAFAGADKDALAEVGGFLGRPAGFQR